VLAPDLPFVSWILLGIFVALVALLGYRAQRKDRREYQRFKRYRSTARRQAMYRKWLRESFLTFGGLALLLLVLVWQFVPLVLNEVNGWDGVRSLRDWYASLGWLSIALTIALTFLIVVLPILLVFLARTQEDVTSIGDIQALLPRNTHELRLGALLSLNAGLVEELLFRLALPALLYGAFGNAFFALLASALLFGGLHAYQGAAGIIGTTLVGAFLLTLYVATGSILVPIIVHVLIDLRSFVLIPVIVLRVGRVAQT
jgi:membrane protease YdiL (CAAX protease family)